ncbi:MAG: dihydroxyacetone kinase subunit DhaK [Clostridiales bacterium]|nr:dihydroxyacetone kinase subunit DhaK [Clostridiales bacterium]
MNKIMNRPDSFVDESLSGIVLAHGDALKFAQGDHRSVVRADAPVAGKVAIVTGGGYGHLPVFLGYVGKGFCDGVAVGNVFTSPSCDAIVDAARAANGGAGVLFLFGNYMGDTMNFEMAAELLDMDDIPTAIVKAADDIASAPRATFQDRRGVGGIFFPYKLAGAKAERMASLDEVRGIAESVCANVATLGFSMSSCQLPGMPKPIFEISATEMELGMGIHGEPGVERTTMKSSAELAEILSEKLCADLAVKEGDEVAVLVNSLGATSKEELYILYNDFHACLERRQIRVEKVFVGEYATSLEMLGASVSLLKLNEEFKQLLSDSACTPFVRV